MSKPSDEEIKAMLEAQASEVPLQTANVEGAAGTEFTVLSPEEARWFESSLEQYQEQYHFDNIADLQDLDRLLALELLSYRYAAWLIRDGDYEGNAFDEKAVRDHKDKIDKELRNIKAHMGIGRKSRTESESQSTADYLSNLLQRAGEMGIHRDEQNAKIIDLFSQLKSKVGLHDRSDDEERTHNKVHTDDIMNWLREEAFPAYDGLDDAFRENQKMWIKDL